MVLSWYVQELIACRSDESWTREGMTKSEHLSKPRAGIDKEIHSDANVDGFDYCNNSSPFDTRLLRFFKTREIMSTAMLLN